LVFNCKKDRFPFLGIPKPRLNEIMKPYIRMAAKRQMADWDFIFRCWEKEYRETKAIGWSLREYSKINPDWVKVFLEKQEGRLSRLSVKEASKYL
jgi:3-methyladenine DNA glycosylase AlkD